MAESWVAAAARILAQEIEVDGEFGDVTTRLLGEASDTPARMTVVSQQQGIFCGEAVVYALADMAEVEVEMIAEDGAPCGRGDILLHIHATAEACLTLERPLLNLLSHLSGVSTLTRQFVDRVEGTEARILATRKTLPGLRHLQLYAVEVGGGSIHRRSLGDGILIKENHQIFLQGTGLLKRARSERSPLHGIEIEIQDPKLLDEVLQLQPDVIMLDNFSVEMLKETVPRLKGRCRIEASGGVNLDTVAQIAQTGVDYISVGALTHSAPILNFSADITKL